MDNTLKIDILKAYDNLQNIEFTINNNKHKFYFRYLTILEHTRIKMACTKKTTIINSDGTKEERFEENKDLYPIYTILEKALDENGKKLFSITNMDQFQMFSKMPFELLSFIAAEMSIDITGNINKLFEEVKNDK